MVLPGVSKTRELDFCVSPSLLMAKPWSGFIYQPLPDTLCKPSAIFGFFDIKTSVSCVLLINFSSLPVVMVIVSSKGINLCKVSLFPMCFLPACLL